MMLKMMSKYGVKKKQNLMITTLFVTLYRVLDAMVFVMYGAFIFYITTMMQTLLNERNPNNSYLPIYFIYVFTVCLHIVCFSGFTRNFRRRRRLQELLLLNHHYRERFLFNDGSSDISRNTNRFNTNRAFISVGNSHSNITDRESLIDNYDVYEFGIHYSYWLKDKNDKNYLKAKHKDLKDEILNNKQHNLSEFEWQNLYNKSGGLLQDSKFRDKFRANKNEYLLQKYNIQPDTVIDNEHLLAIKLYTDCDGLQYNFRLTFRRAVDSDNEKYLEFYHFGKLLHETVQIYGTEYTENEIFYHGFCGDNIVPKMFFKINMPISTSKDIDIASNFASVSLDDHGIILKLSSYHDKVIGLDVEGISKFENEKEVIFFGADLCLNGYQSRYKYSHISNLDIFLRNGFILVEQLLRGHFINSKYINEVQVGTLVTFLDGLIHDRIDVDMTGYHIFCFIKMIQQLNIVWLNINELTKHMNGRIEGLIKYFIESENDVYRHGKFVQWISERYLIEIKYCNNVEIPLREALDDSLVITNKSIIHNDDEILHLKTKFEIIVSKLIKNDYQVNINFIYCNQNKKIDGSCLALQPSNNSRYCVDFYDAQINDCCAEFGVHSINNIILIIQIDSSKYND